MTLHLLLLFALAAPGQLPTAPLRSSPATALLAPEFSSATDVSKAPPPNVAFEDLTSFKRQYMRSLGAGAAATGIGIALGMLSMRGSQDDFGMLVGGVVGGTVAFPLGCAYGAATTDSLMEARGSAMIAVLGAIAGMYAGGGLAAGTGGILIPCFVLLPPLGATMVQRFSVRRSLRVHPVVQADGGGLRMDLTFR